jgi:outer membrane lipoprotein carrier protein
VARIAVLALLALPVLAADDSMTQLLRAVEKHYNGVRTLQVTFNETYTGVGRPHRQEAGELYLRKPGKMRWQYTNPLGKIFMSDGKQVYYFNPVTNRAERTQLKETEDLRAPLAFLLGRLDFRKDFKDFAVREESGVKVIQATPKSDRLPYKQVEFTVSPQHEIRRLLVTGQDNALLTFQFGNERMNPPLDDKLFRFQLPAGAAWVETAEQEASK